MITFMNLAHRGASHYAPENTMAAFRLGLALGASGLETDIQRSKDGVLFLLHDDTLDRTTNGRGHPHEYTWEELSRLDAGSWFSDEFKEEKLVSLEQFLSAFGPQQLHIALELKASGIEAEVLEMIIRLGVLDKITLTSFRYEHLVEVRRLNRQVKIGYLIHQADEQALAQLLRIDGNQLCPRADRLTEEAVARAKAKGLHVRAWGIRDEEIMHRALRCGVDGMTVNFPDLLARAIQ